jgi:tetratricopeptide (TPR) repeat protein
MQQGDYEQAISYLKSATLDDNIAGAVAKGTIGDAYVELGNYGDAHAWYDKAVSHSANSLTAPLYLMKAALLYEDQGDFKKALTNYNTIKEKYPTSKEAQGIESYIARVGG